jgi:hypothetical protein
MLAQDTSPPRDVPDEHSETDYGETAQRTNHGVNFTLANGVDGAVQGC